ncbi:Valine--tRNA ligase [bioreactor metagenome]|uniref:valine--tRNA ligase n=2 Tax=root TaxID=1 RepID=A0A645HHW7_9ZZZZ
MDVEAELQKLKTELTYTEGFLQSVLKKLSNERFVQNAKPEIVEGERKKQADAESKIALLKENIAALEK